MAQSTNSSEQDPETDPEKSAPYQIYLPIIFIDDDRAEKPYRADFNCSTIPSTYEPEVGVVTTILTLKGLLSATDPYKIETYVRGWLEADNQGLDGVKLSRLDTLLFEMSLLATRPLSEQLQYLQYYTDMALNALKAKLFN